MNMTVALSLSLSCHPARRRALQRTCHARRVWWPLLTLLLLAGAPLPGELSGLVGTAQAQGMLAARVNGVGITLELLDRQFEDLLRERNLHIARLQNPARAKELKREALDRLIRIELLWQEARRIGMAAGDDEVERAVADTRGRFRSPDQLDRRIVLSGYTASTFREHTRKLLSGDRYAQTVVEREVRVETADVEAFYRTNPGLFKRKEQVKVRQILIAAPAAASAPASGYASASPAVSTATSTGPEVAGAESARARARRQIEALRARILAGESIDALARQFSDDVTRQWGGEMDPFGRGEQPPEIEAAAFALAPGAVSEVIDSPAGLRILQLEQHVPAVTLTVAEVDEPVRQHLRNTRGKEALDREVERLRTTGKVDVLTPL
jgi:parvulin-like peptidyl-prolyl isomerase